MDGKKAGKDCIVCHHTGDPVACATCHTVQGSAEGGFVTLYTAMHAQKVAPRKEGTPASCVSCHNKQLANRNCAGCHKTLVKDKKVQNEAWCVVCHSMTPEMTKSKWKPALQGSCPQDRTKPWLSKTALARKQADYWSPMKGPYKVVINELQGKYEPCVFNHRHHVASLMERIRTTSSRARSIPIRPLFVLLATITARHRSIHPNVSVATVKPSIRPNLTGLLCLPPIICNA